ncbi:MAG: glycosyltransferase family 9 protein [Gemmatimonadales bacterium]
MSDIPRVPRILLLRLSSIGDVILTTPLVRALRSRLPEAHIAFMTRREFTPLLSEHPALDEVLPFEGGTSIRELAARLRREKFTDILDLHGTPRTRLLRYLVPGRWRGYRHHRLARDILIRFKRDVYPRHLPVAERYFDAARELGIEPDGGPPEFHLAPAAVENVRGFLGEHRLGRDRPLVALAPGAAHVTKRWPAARWDEFIRILVKDGFDCILLGGPDDAELAGMLAMPGGKHTVSAAGKFGLQETGAAIRESRVLVSGDTGVMHMGTATGTPVIALFGPTVEQFGFFPYRSHNLVIQQDLDCRPCTAWGTERCPLGHHRCLVDTAAADVRAALGRILT